MAPSLAIAMQISRLHITESTSRRIANRSLTWLGLAVPPGRNPSSIYCQCHQLDPSATSSTSTTWDSAMNTKETLALGLHHHQVGNLAQAEQLYRQVLDSNPDDYEALQLLGVLVVQTGRHEAGIEYLRQALRLDPNNAPAQFNLGSALRKQGQLDEAIASYRR